MHQQLYGRALRNGLKHELEVAADGLPDGVAAAPVKVPAAGTVAVLRLTTRAGAGSGPFTIIGKVIGSPELTRTARASIVELNASTTRPWLTVARVPDAATTSKKN